MSTKKNPISNSLNRATLWLGRKSQAFFDSKAFKKMDDWYINLPMLGYKDIKVAEVIFYFLSGIGEGKVWQRAKGLAYSLLMALPPLLIFLFTLIAYLPIDGIQDELMGQLHDLIPENFYHKINSTIDDVVGHRHNSLMSIGFLVSVFLAANGIYGMYRSINNNPEVEHKKFLPVYGSSILMVFLLFILLTAAMGLLVGYKLMLRYLMAGDYIAPSKVSMFAINMGRWVILTALTLLVLVILYRFVMVKQSNRQGLHFLSIGSVVATALFFLLTWGFQIYLNLFNQFNLLYGSIGTLLMVMLWLFANCYVILAGYEINISVIKSAEDPDQWLSMRKSKQMMRKARRLGRPYRNILPKNQFESDNFKDNTAESNSQYPTIRLEVTLHEKDGRWIEAGTKIINTKPE